MYRCILCIVRFGKAGYGMFESIKQKIRGPIAFPVTPFKLGGSGLVVDAGAMEQQIQYILDGGVLIVTPCGGTGEFFSLTLPEWKETVIAAMRAAKGRGVVFPGVGHDPDTAVEMTAFAKDSGCDGVVVIPPMTMFGTVDRGIYYYYEYIANRVTFPLIPYKVNWSPMSVVLLKELAEIESVVAIKEESGDINWFKQAMDELGNRIVGICAKAEMMAPFYYLAGAKAYTTGIGDFLPKLTAEFNTLLENKDFMGAMDMLPLFRELTEMRNQAGCQTTIVKEALSMLSICEPHVRPPLIPIDDKKREAVAQIMRRHKAIS